MILVVGLLAGAGILMWPARFGRSALAIMHKEPSVLVPVVPRTPRSIWELVRLRLPGRSRTAVSSQDLLSLLEAVAPALEAGMTPAAALQLACDSSMECDRAGSLAALASSMAATAADGAPLAPRWHQAAESARSAELLLLAQAWSLTEDMGVPLAQAVRTTAGLLEARVAHERRLAGAVAGASATVNVLTVLPVGGPLLALALGIGPGELYGGSSLTQASLAMGVALAVLGRWWVRRMVRAVARGPVIR